MPTSLPSSSSISDLDPGSSFGISSNQVGERKMCSDQNWYYLYLRNAELKRMITLFTGEKEVYQYEKVCNNGIVTSQLVAVKKITRKIFVYTAVEHERKRNATLSKQEYEQQRQVAEFVTPAFYNQSVETWNKLILNKNISGDGFLFVYASLQDLYDILIHTIPTHTLVCKYKSQEPAAIPTHEMLQFIYLYESTPLHLELMAQPLETYLKTKQKIRITEGLFKGKEGCLIRMHRNMRLVLALGTLTVSVSDLKTFPFEKINE